MKLGKNYLQHSAGKFRLMLLTSNTTVPISVWIGGLHCTDY